jgi:glycosyltransferase involved in cell wall biosynthesis
MEVCSKIKVFIKYKELKIIIFTQSPLSKAPRVVKEANVLIKHGYDVAIFGIWYSDAIVKLDKSLISTRIKYFPGVDLRNKNSFRVFYLRSINKLSRYLVRFLKIQTKHALGYGYKKYLKRLVKENADLYIGHEEMSLPLIIDLKKKNKKVVFDFEDFHSEDLLPKDRRYRPISLLEFFEKEVLFKADLTYTTSKELASAFALKYKCNIPQVIYNSFEYSPISYVDSVENSLVWISQIIGPGRGLELLFEALSFVKQDISVHLIGENKLPIEMIQEFPKNVKVVFHKTIMPKEIQMFLAQFDLGIAIEPTLPKSREYTITNKVFHYFNSGIGILATHTSGQNEIKTLVPDAVEIIERSPAQFGKKIDQLFTDRSRILEMKAASIEAGISLFNYANEEKKLSKLIKDVFSI